jgi:radical SAM protein with 4Fe4S-binding SPASM domain
MYALEEITSNVDILRLAVADAQPFIPLYVKIKLNYACNLRCEMCKHWRLKREDPLPAAYFHSLIDDLAQLGCRKIHLSGGEPLLRSEMPELVAHASQLGMRVTLTTNGTLVDKALAKQLVQAGLRGVSVSIDSPVRKVHDHIRGVPGAWKKSLRAVQFFRRYTHKGKLTIRVNTVVSRLNYDSLVGLPDLLKRVGADALHLIAVDDHCGEYLSLRWADLEAYNTRIAPTLAERGLAFGLIADEAQAYPFGRSEKQIRHARHGEYAFGWYRQHPCYAPWTHSLVDFNGNVFVCCMMRDQMTPLGNLTQTTFGEIWSSAAYQSVRQQMHPPALDACRRCDDFLEQNQMLLNALEAAPAEPQA